MPLRSMVVVVAKGNLVLAGQINVADPEAAAFGRRGRPLDLFRLDSLPSAILHLPLAVADEHPFAILQTNLVNADKTLVRDIEVFQGDIFKPQRYVPADSWYVLWPFPAAVSEIPRPAAFLWQSCRYCLWLSQQTIRVRPIRRPWGTATTTSRRVSAMQVRVSFLPASTVNESFVLVGGSIFFHMAFRNHEDMV